MFSICSHLGAGGGRYLGQVQMGGYPSQVQWGGTHLGSPLSDLAREYPARGCPTSGTPPVGPGWGGCLTSGTPHQTWLGGTLPGGAPPRVPPCQTWLGGYPARGVPHLRYPPLSDLAGGTPLGGAPPWVPPLSDLVRGGTPPHTG